MGTERSLFGRTVLVLLLVTLATFASLSGEAEFAEKQPLQVCPLSLGSSFVSLSMKLAHPVNKGSFEVCGATFAIEKRKKDYAWQSGQDKGTFKSLPAIIEFGSPGNKRAVSLIEDANGQMFWSPHWGFEVLLDNEVIWILDADMDGKLGELKDDGLAGPNSGVVQPFSGVAWTHKGGYEISFESTTKGMKIGKKPIAMPKEGKNSDLNKGWTLFNCWRQRAGAGQLEWDEKMEKQCQKHAEYCHKTGYMGHEEDPDDPHYTPEGDRGGRSSNCGYAYSTFYESTLEQFRTVYHCAQMLDPNLKRSAMALVGTCYAVDVRNGLTAWRSGNGILFFWPPHGATDVYRDFNPAGEHPMPIEGRMTDFQAKIGQCAFAALNGKGPYEIEILEKDGAPVPSHVTHPEKSASLYGGNDGIICAAPHAPLKSASWFRVNIRCGQKGSQNFLAFSWDFKTR